MSDRPEAPRWFVIACTTFVFLAIGVPVVSLVAVGVIKIVAGIWTLL